MCRDPEANRTKECSKYTDSKYICMCILKIYIFVVVAQQRDTLELQLKQPKIFQTKLSENTEKSL